MKSLLLSASALIAASFSAAEAASSKRVVFESGGDRLVGDLYLPDGYEAGDKLPAVIVTGAWTTVKEQMPARYAAELADRGFAALAFDFRGWGQSEGAPRQYEHPARKTADIIAAAAFLSTRPEVDRDRIGGLGVCASAGYMAGATAASPHIQSLALVAPWLHNAEIVDAVYGGADGVAGLVAVSRDADAAYAQTGAERMTLAASSDDPDAVMTQAPYYTERKRGLIPEYINQFNLASWEPWLSYDAVTIAGDLGDTPVQIVHSDAAAIPDGARAFYADLQGDKSALWLDNVLQFDFYDRDEPVRQASDAVAAHLERTLK